VIEERDSGIVRMQSVFSPVYIDALVERDRDPTGSGTLTERLYAQQDATWNVTALLDTSGNVQERYVYDPYGQATVLTPSWTVRASSAYAWVYLHQGGRYDNTSGLYLFRNRDYSPVLGRWMQENSLEFADAVNLYTYDSNSPANWVDPLGQAASKAPDFRFKPEARCLPGPTKEQGTPKYSFQDFPTYKYPPANHLYFPDKVSRVPGDIAAVEKDHCIFRAETPPGTTENDTFYIPKRVSDKKDGVRFYPRITDWENLETVCKDALREGGCKRISVHGHGAWSPYAPYDAWQVGVAALFRGRFNYSYTEVLTPHTTRPDLRRCLHALLEKGKVPEKQRYLRICACNGNTKIYTGLKTLADKLGMKVCACLGKNSDWKWQTPREKDDSKRRYCHCVGVWVCADPAKWGP
jgi:RHS repeat-associated protein